MTYILPWLVDAKCMSNWSHSLNCTLFCFYDTTYLFLILSAAAPANDPCPVLSCHISEDSHILKAVKDLMCMDCYLRGFGLPREKAPLVKHAFLVTIVYFHMSLIVPFSALCSWSTLSKSFSISRELFL